LDGKSTTYDNVIRYEFSKNGKQLAFVTKKPEEKRIKRKERIQQKINLLAKKDTDKSNLKNTLQTVQVVDLKRNCQ
jgi:hypothetical protein